MIPKCDKVTNGYPNSDNAYSAYAHLKRNQNEKKGSLIFISWFSCWLCKANEITLVLFLKSKKGHQQDEKKEENEKKVGSPLFIVGGDSRLMNADMRTGGALWFSWCPYFDDSNTNREAN